MIANTPKAVDAKALGAPAAPATEITGVGVKDSAATVVPELTATTGVDDSTGLTVTGTAVV